MKRAWKVSWYNKDDYGWTDHLSVVLHGDEMNEIQAHQAAISQVMDTYELHNNEIFLSYEHLEILEVTRDTVLSIHMSASGV